MAKFQKGQSGNPAGAPKKNRALTRILETAGSATIERDGKKLSGKRLIAALLWDIAKTGTCTLPSGKVYNVDGAGWFDVVKFLYAQIDGPPKQNMDLGGMVETRGEIKHVIYSDTAKNIFDILAESGVIKPEVGDAKDDQIHTPPTDG